MTVHSATDNFIEQQWNATDPGKIQGCMFPSPEKDDYLIDTTGQVWRFVSVKEMGNPHDGFFADVERTACKFIDGGDGLPTDEEIDQFLVDCADQPNGWRWSRPDTPVDRTCAFCSEPFTDDSPGKRERFFCQPQCRKDKHKVAQHIGERVIEAMPANARVAYLENLRD